MKSSRIALLTCLLSQAAWAAPDSEIRVRIQDYAGVKEKTRAAAFAVASTILENASVAPVWLDCSPSLAADMDAQCKQQPTAQDVILRLMPEKMAAAAGLKTACLGYAAVPRDSFGSIAAVFVDKARRTADRSLAQRASVLGHAIAHEIAHLLIGKATHSPRGLMQAVWSRADLLTATARPMTLTEKEAVRIRRNVESRARRVR